MRPPELSVRSAEVILPCTELEPSLAFFTERLGFRIETLSPADDPALVVLSGHGLRLCLQRGFPGAAGTLRLVCEDPAALAGGALELTAPNGTRIELARAERSLAIPPLVPAFEFARHSEGARWVTGRAGMQYRDLTPGRQGGRFLASHIRIRDGGAVPDYVHYHRVRFQLIHCVRGWARLVYEDQGPPFVLQAGECVLQPPGIRHRVLECSPGLEVVEVVCPAQHDTCADHELGLPTEDLRPARSFGGQRFVRSVPSAGNPVPWRTAGFECRETGIAEATEGLVGARLVRANGAPPAEPSRHDAELLFVFVVRGAVTLAHVGGAPERLGCGDAVVLPREYGHAWSRPTADLEFLEVTSPAQCRSFPARDMVRSS